VALVDALIKEAHLRGILGNKRASGTDIIRELGEEHVRTGKPICYTSADSVFQIAAHETHFGLERLYAVCAIARRLVDSLNIGRVIARPFIGETAETFVRTSNRRDYSVPPPEPTLLDRLAAKGRRVVGIGKIADIFAHRGITDVVKGRNDAALIDETVALLDVLGDGDLAFANFVEFDTLCGHRRDVARYANTLEAFDRRVPELLARLRPGDLAVLTADHGNDPTWTGTDHTREHLPILVAGPGIEPGEIGRRETLADIGATIAEHLGIPAGKHGRPFL
jgi:phosphopentomutase